MIDALEALGEDRAQNIRGTILCPKCGSKSLLIYGMGNSDPHMQAMCPECQQSHILVPEYVIGR